MANVYVRSGAGGAATGADWANAYTTLAAALTAKAAGDDFWVSEDHAETQASAMTLTSPGTAASPCRIICVSHTGSVPPVSADLATTATISVTGSFSLSFGAGLAYVRGITFNATNAAGTGNLQVTAATVGNWIFDSCNLKVLGTGSTNQIIFGPSASGNPWFRVELINTPLTFAATGQKITVRACELIWRNTASAIGGTVPTTLMTVAATTGVPLIQMYGLDLSAAGSGKTLFDVSIAASYFVQMWDCKLGASVAITSGSVSGPVGAKVRVENCDSADTKYRYYYQDYKGTEQSETTIVRTSGASDGTTTISRKMVSSANTKLYSSLDSEWMEIWSDSAGAHTITIPIVNDGVTLQNTDIHAQVEYQGTSGFPQGSFASNGPADILAAGSNLTTDVSSTWTTTGLASPVKQSLAVSFTTTGKGVIRVRVRLSKASQTVYVDPLIQLT